MNRLHPELQRHANHPSFRASVPSFQFRRLAAACLLASGLVNGCDSAAGSSGAPSVVTAEQLEHLQSLAGQCPAGESKLTQYVGLDLSGSGADASIDADRDAAVQAIVERGATCSGYLHVVAFTGSVAATKVLFAGDLTATGATEIARLRRVPGLVEQTVSTIRNARDAAAGTLDRGGSDITAQYGLAAEVFAQKGADGAARVFTVDLLTDGLQTVGANLNIPELSVAAAEDLARSVPAPTLPPGTTVTISGIGRTAGAPASTQFVEALKSFHATYCRRSTGTGDSKSCHALTDFIA